MFMTFSAEFWLYVVSFACLVGFGIIRLVVKRVFGKKVQCNRWKLKLTTHAAFYTVVSENEDLGWNNTLVLSLYPPEQQDKVIYID